MVGISPGHCRLAVSLFDNNFDNALNYSGCLHAIWDIGFWPVRVFAAGSDGKNQRIMVIDGCPSHWHR